MARTYSIRIWKQSILIIFWFKINGKEHKKKLD
jgi:hypothetical protein